MKKKVLIISIVLLLILLLFFVIKNTSKIEYFKPIKISYNNEVMNGVNPSFYDTILYVGLDKLGIQNQKIIINKLPQNAQSSFDGELVAHIRYHDNIFFLFVNELSRTEAIKVLSHEMIHIKQYLSRDIVYENGVVTWKGEEIDLSRVEYDRRPWEIEAFRDETEIKNHIEKTLW